MYLYITALRTYMYTYYHLPAPLCSTISFIVHIKWILVYNYVYTLYIVWCLSYVYVIDSADFGGTLC